MIDRQTDEQTSMAKAMCTPTLKWGDIMKLSGNGHNDNVHLPWHKKRRDEQ